MRWLPTIIVAALALLMYWAWVAMAPVHAQQPVISCDNLSDVLKEIGRFGETPHFVGVTGNDGGIPVMGFVNKVTGTFTFVLRPTPSRGCVVLEGGGFQALEPTEPPKPGKDL